MSAETESERVNLDYEVDRPDSEIWVNKESSLLLRGLGGTWQNGLPHG